MTNISDQSTAKVHKFTLNFAIEMVKKIRKHTDFKMSEIIMYDVAMFRLMEEFKQVDWASEVKANHFMEKMMNDVFEIQKLVTVKIRNVNPYEGSDKKQ